MAKMKVNREALAVKHAVCKDPYRMALNCVKVTPEECIATNGRILIRIKNKAKQEDDANGELILKPSVLQFMAKMFGRNNLNLPVELEQTEEDKLLINGHDGATELSVSTRPMPKEYKFPNCEQVMPPDTEEKFVLNVALLEKMVKAAKEAKIGNLHFKASSNKFHAIEITGDEEDGFTAIIMPIRRAD